MFVFGATVAGPLLMIETSAWLAAVMVMLQLWLAVFGTESVALAVKTSKLIGPVGVPVTAPVKPFRIKFGGSAPVIENE